MAVPKRKTSPSKRGMRRSHSAIPHVNVVKDDITGEYRLPHHMSSESKMYKGREVIIEDLDEEEDLDEDDE